MTKQTMLDWLNANPLIKDEMRMANNDTMAWYIRNQRLADAELAKAKKRLDLHEEHEVDATQARIDVEVAQFMTEWWRQEWGDWLKGLREALDSET